MSVFTVSHLLTEEHRGMDLIRTSVFMEGILPQFDKFMRD